MNAGQRPKGRGRLSPLIYRRRNEDRHQLATHTPSNPNPTNAIEDGSGTTCATNSSLMPTNGEPLYKNDVPTGVVG